MKPDPAQASEKASGQAHAADRYSLLPGQTPEGGFILSVLFKRTYDFFPDRQCERAEKDAPLFSGDVYHDDPANSSVKYESDFVPYKTATDIVLTGVAHAPGAKPAEQFETRLTVGNHCKTVLVVGDRFCRYESDTKRTFTDPVPVENVEMVYERAFGGIDILSDERVRFPYPRNPLGTGFVVDTGRNAVDGLRLPNFEDPENRLTRRTFAPASIRIGKSFPCPPGSGGCPDTGSPGPPEAASCLRTGNSSGGFATPTPRYFPESSAKNTWGIRCRPWISVFQRRFARIGRCVSVRRGTSHAGQSYPGRQKFRSACRDSGPRSGSTSATAFRNPRRSCTRWRFAQKTARRTWCGGARYPIRVPTGCRK